MLGAALETIELVMERRVLQKLLNISDNNYSLDTVFSGILLELHCNMDHYRKSFLPTATGDSSCPLVHLMLLLLLP